MRTAARVDENQSAIVGAFRSMGASVLLLHQLGQGCPDVLIGWRGTNLLVECKDGSKPKYRQKLTHDQEIFHAAWRGQLVIIDSINAAAELLRTHKGGA